MSRAGCWPTTVLLLISVAVSADDSAVEKSSVEKLVRQLGSQSFEMREEAAQRLVELGPDAVDTLAAVRNHPDLEIRLRVGRVLDEISRSDFERKLAAFVDDESPDASYGLPSWQRFQKLVSSNRAARQLFADMIRSERSLLESYQNDPAPEVRDRFLQRVQPYQSNGVPDLRKEISPAALATFLMLGADPDLALETAVGYQLIALLNQTKVIKLVQSDERSEMIRQLLVSWLRASASDHRLAGSGLALTLKYGLSEIGVDLARRLVVQENAFVTTLPTAILTIAKHGDKSDRKIIEPLLSDQRVCHTYRRGNFRLVIHTQVRDVALVTLIHLTGQDHKEYGFDQLMEDDILLYHVSTCGFLDDRQRAAALAKWAEWAKTN